MQVPDVYIVKDILKLQSACPVGVLIFIAAPAKVTDNDEIFAFPCAAESESSLQAYLALLRLLNMLLFYHLRCWYIS